MVAGFPGNLQEMLQKAQEFQQQFQEIQRDLETREVEASAGGGMVRAKVSGAGLVTAISIEPTVVNPAEIEMLQDLISAAVNEAVRKSKEMVREELQKASGGIPIPGLGNFKF